VKAWYVIQTKSGDEERADMNLFQQGYKTYLPLVKKHVSKRRYPQRITDPMFPGYMFISLDDSINGDDFSPVKSTRGVMHIVLFGNKPAKLKDGIIEMLQDQESEDNLHHIEKTEYEEGQEVRIKAGAFKLYRGIIEAQANERIHLVLSESNTKLTLSTKEVEPV